MTAIAANIEAITNLIWMMIANTENQKSRNAIKRKSVGNTRNRTRQTHHRDIVIRLTTVTIDARDTRVTRATIKRIL